MSTKWAKENPEKQKEYRRKYYLQNRQKEIEYSLKRNKIVRKTTKTYITEIKENSKCCICSEDHSATLVFHHMEPEKKEFNIAGSESKYTLSKIKREIKKCIILCANCHCKLHADDNFQEKYKHLMGL